MELPKIATLLVACDSVTKSKKSFKEENLSIFILVTT